MRDLLYKSRSFGSFWSGAFRCVLTQCQGRHDLREAIVDAINLRRVTLSFPNNLKSIILQ